LASFIGVSAVENLEAIFDLVSLQRLRELAIGVLNTNFLRSGVERDAPETMQVRNDQRDRLGMRIAVGGN